MRMQSAPFIQPLNKDCLQCLHTTWTTHQQNELLVKRSVGLSRIAALYKNPVQTYIRRIRETHKVLCCSPGNDQADVQWFYVLLNCTHSGISCYSNTTLPITKWVVGSSLECSSVALWVCDSPAWRRALWSCYRLREQNALCYTLSTMLWTMFFQRVLHLIWGLEGWRWSAWHKIEP